MKNDFGIDIMPEFMLNKRCPKCGSDMFVTIQKGGQDFRLWKCGRCEYEIFRELIDTRSFFQRIFHYKKKKEVTGNSSHE